MNYDNLRSIFLEKYQIYLVPKCNYDTFKINRCVKNKC